MFLGVTPGINVVLEVPPFVPQRVDGSFIPLLVEMRHGQGLLILRRFGVFLQLDMVLQFSLSNVPTSWPSMVSVYFPGARP